MNKGYNAQAALLQPQEGQEAESGKEAENQEIDFQELINSFPEEFQGEMEESLASLLSFIHSDEGTAFIIDNVQQAKGKEEEVIGSLALQIMDKVDTDHNWSDSAKIMAGYFAVSEICEIARAAKVIDIPQEKSKDIFKAAAQNYIQSMIKSKPTKKAREQEAIRIQKEMDPLAKAAANAEAGGEQQQEAEQETAQKQGGLLT